MSNRPRPDLAHDQRAAAHAPVQLWRRIARSVLISAVALLIVAHQAGLLQSLRLAVAERRWPSSSGSTRDRVE